jgi:hypothetical protein
MADELNGFDMVWAVTEQTLNDQLGAIFGGAARPGGPDLARVSFGELFEADGKTVKDGLHVDGVLAPPRIEIPEGNASTVLLFLTFASGTLQHLDLQQAGVLSVDLTPDPRRPAATTWTLCLEVDVNVADIGERLDCRSTRPPSGMHPQTFQQLCHFKTTGFSVRQLFLGLENVDLARFRPDRSMIPEGVTATYRRDGTTTLDTPDPNAGPDLQMAMALYLQHLGSDNNPYVLGYTTEAGANETSAFQPTATAYSTRRYQPARNDSFYPGLSTLNLLLVTHHRRLPLASLGFNYNLVGRLGISGTGRVANATVVGDWLANPRAPGGSLIDAVAGAFGMAAGSLTYQPASFQWVGALEVPIHDAVFGRPGVVGTELRAATVRLSRHETDASGRSGPGLAIEGSFGYRIRCADYYFGFGTYTHVEPFRQSIVIRPELGPGGSSVELTSSQLIRQPPQETFDLRGGEFYGPREFDALVGNPLNPRFQQFQSLEIGKIGPTMNAALRALSGQIILPAPTTFVYRSLAFDEVFTLIAEFDYVMYSSSSSVPEG